MTTPTPTPLDIQWLHNQINDALAAAGAAPSALVTLPRATLALVACVLSTDHPATPAAPTLASRYQIAADQLRPAVIAEMQRLARNGEAPTKRHWDHHRHHRLPSAQHVCRVLDARWPELADAAGLRLNRYARRFPDSPAGSAAAAGPSDDDIAGPPILEATDYGDLPVAASRTEIVTAGAIQTIRTYHMLR